MGLFKEEMAGVNVSGGVSIEVALNPLCWILWFLDFIAWLVYFLVIGWVFALLNVLSAKPYGKNTEGSTWRCNYGVEDPNLVTGPDPKMETAWDCFDGAFKKFSATNAMGTRTYLGEWRSEKGHKIVKKIFGETTWRTYGQVGARAEAFGRGLRALGMSPSKALSKKEFEANDDPDTLLLWEDTCADWMTTAAAAFSQSLVVATSYSTLGVDGVIEAVEQCQCPVVVCNRHQVAALVEARKSLSNPGRLSTIIYTDLNQGGGHAYGGIKDIPLDLGDVTDSSGPLPALEIEVEGLKIMHWDEVVTLGNSSEHAAMEPERPKPGTMAVVMYTSGSTGKPKGVLIAHKNLCASVGGMHKNFSQWGAEGQETYLAYLPAAHILELVAEIAMLSFGSAIGYADPRTIASAGACKYHRTGGSPTINFDPSLDLAPGAIQEFKPSCLAAVPKIWDILKKSVEDGVGKGSAVSRIIFEAAFAAVKNAQSWRSCPLLNLLFTKKVGAVVGGRMKTGISGGGPLSNEVQSFCRIAFGFPLIQGYALTETCCAGCVQLVDDSRDGVVGAPLASVEIMLESCPAIQDRNGKPYMVTDTNHWDTSACMGRGEVLIRGPSVSMGYYARGDQAETLTKKTTEEFSSETPNQEPGQYDWFHSGDIGLFTPDGCLKLIDRKKNLVKLKGGEYIAIEAMEAEYSTSVFVDAKLGGIMAHGDGDLDKPVAIAQANIPELKKWAEANGIDASDPDALCANEAVVKMVLDDMKSIAKLKLAKNEVICAIALISGSGPTVWPGNNKSPWTPENGFLTASNKIDRNAIKNGKFMKEGEPPSDSFMDVLQPLREKAGAAAGDTNC